MVGLFQFDNLCNSKTSFTLLKYNFILTINYISNDSVMNHNLCPVQYNSEQGHVYYHHNHLVDQIQKTPLY